MPILFYHVIAVPPPGTPNIGLWVPPGVFRAQMRFLASDRFHAVTLQQVWNYWRHGARIPLHPIVISFDDGFRGQYHFAMPILAALHWPGVMNLALSHFNQPGWGLSTRMIQAMLGNGWELDSHTMTHADLPTLDSAALWREVHESRAILQKTFGPVNFFCYPYGHYDSTVLAAVKRAGYLAATTTTYGVADPSQGMLTLDRIEITNSDGVSGLAAKLTGFHLIG